MFKRLFRVAFASMCLYTPFAHSLSNPTTYEESCGFMTYDWLITVGIQKYTMDYLPHFKYLFKKMKVRGLLDCGPSYATKYFLDNAQQVTSVEMLPAGSSDSNYQDCLLLYKNATNWFPFTYLGTKSFNAANLYQSTAHKDYALIDSRYVKELEKFFAEKVNLARANKCPIDVAFVNPAGVYIRGDIVNALLAQKVPVVVAHDTASDTDSAIKEGVYGWFKVQTPPDYIKIHIPFEYGTTFWVNKQYPLLVRDLQKYRDAIQRAFPTSKSSGLKYQEISKIADKK